MPAQTPKLYDLLTYRQVDEELEGNQMSIRLSKEKLLQSAVKASMTQVSDDSSRQTQSDHSSLQSHNQVLPRTSFSRATEGQF